MNATFNTGRFDFGKRLLTAAAITTMGLTVAQQADAQGYTVKDLGTLPGRVASAAWAQTNGNLIVGGSKSPTPMRAVLWMGGLKFNLGTLPGYLGSFARGVNASGQVVGYAFNDNTNVRAFRWQGGVMSDLGAFPGGTRSIANAIHPLGRIVGGAERADGSIHAAMWIGSSIFDLGTLPGGSFSSAHAINETSKVVGEAYTAINTLHAFTWDNLTGVMSDLGTLGGQHSEAFDINALGRVVGYAHTPAETRHAALWKNGLIQDLGTLPGYANSIAFSINNFGRVVGNVYNDVSSPRAMVYRKGTMHDLNSLIPAASGWTLEQAISINDNGRIVGWGMHGGKRHAFALTPKVAVVDVSKWVAYNPFYVVCDPKESIIKAKITNTSKIALHGPFHIALTGMTPGRRLWNGDGLFRESPYITLDLKSLAAGESVEVVLECDGSVTKEAPSFSVKVYSGSL